MNSHRILHYIRQVQGYIHKVVKREVTRTRRQLWKPDCYINIPDNDIEIADRICKQTLVPNSKDRLMKAVSLFVIEEGVILNVRHYSPHLKTSYYNTNKKYKPLHSRSTWFKNSIHRTICSSSLLRLCGPCTQENSCLRQRFCNPLQYTSVRSWSSRRTHANGLLKDSCRRCSCMSKQLGTETNNLTFDQLSEEVSLANKKLINKYTLKDSNLSDTARRLLQDLNITGEDSKIDVGNQNTENINACRYRIESPNTSHIYKYSDLKSIVVLSKVISKDNYTMIANYYQEKSKPFTINSRLWRNYAMSHPLNMLPSNKHNQIETSNEHRNFEFYSTDFKKEDHGFISENATDNVKKISNIFKTWATTVQECYNFVISNIRANITYKQPTCKEEHTGIRHKALFLKQNISKQYDFNVKSTIQTNGTSLKAINYVKPNIPNRKICFPSKTEYNEAPNKLFYKQFKRQILGDQSTRGKDPQALLLFCGTLKALMLRMVELNTLRSLEKAIVTRVNTRSLEERTDKRNEKSCPENEINIDNFRFPVNIGGPKRPEFSSYSRKSENENRKATNKTTYVDINVKPYSKESTVSSIEIDDMKVVSCNKNSQFVNKENVELKPSNTELDENLVTSNLNQKQPITERDKYVMLNLKLKLPFLLDDSTNRKVKTRK